MGNYFAQKETIYGLTEVLVHILDISNQVMSVSESYLFSQSAPTTEIPNTNHAEQLMYPGDSIHTLELKISKAIGEVNLRRNGKLPGTYRSGWYESKFEER